MKVIANIKDYPVGTSIEEVLIDELFYYRSLTEDIIKRINGKSYREDCIIPYEKLRYIRVLYRGFDGRTYIGEIIVHGAIAEDVIDVFRELYEENYPIERMLLVDEYDADDKKSMEANNSSGFNYRTVEGTDRLSLHSYGMAIDINPQYNPYITSLNGKTLILPQNGKEHVDRSQENQYYIRKGDVCYKAFTKRGFTWGGDWKDKKDYHHFQKKLPEAEVGLH